MASHSKGNTLLVAAIDFGTSYSGYAFSFRSEFERDPLHISLHLSTGGGRLVSHKKPTVLLLSPDKKFHSFGFEAENHFAKLAEKEEHGKWYYFKNFKMKLHSNSVSNITCKASAV
jgi:hypothetical protein